MPGVAAPHAGGAVEYLAAVVAGIMHALGANQQTGPRLELAVRGERHPEGFEIVRHPDGGGIGHGGKAPNLDQSVKFGIGFAMKREA